MINECDLKEARSISGNENKYESTFNKDSIELPDLESLVRLIGALNYDLHELQLRSKANLDIYFPNVQDSNNSYGAKNKIINEAEIESFFNKQRCVGSALGLNGAGSVLGSLYNNVYRTINQLYNFEKKFNGFEIDLANIYTKYGEAGKNVYDTIYTDFMNDAHDYYAYGCLYCNLRNLTDEHIENSDGSVTYKCTEDGNEVTFKDGQVISVKFDKVVNCKSIYENGEQVDCVLYKSGGLTYFKDRIPYATDYTDLNMHVDYSDKYNITYSWKPEDAYNNKPILVDDTTYMNFNNDEYSGEYLLINNGDVSYQIPLVKFVLVDDKVVAEPLNSYERIIYMDGMTKYCNDIIKKLDGTTDIFKNAVSDKLEYVTVIYSDKNVKNKLYPTSALWCSEYPNSKKSNICVFAEGFFKGSTNAYDYYVDGFIHECGHAFGNDKEIMGYIYGSDGKKYKYEKESYFNFEYDIDDKIEWRNIFDKVSSNSENASIMRDYSMTNPHELFADATMYYYTDSERLKMIDIDYLGYKTLYEYMDALMHGVENKLDDFGGGR